MILRQDQINRYLSDSRSVLDGLPSSADEDPFVINPLPLLKESKNDSTGAVDLRLGTWFLSFKKDHSEALKIVSEGQDDQSSSLTKMHYVPFHRSYFLHPQSFVLAVTLEWIRLPKFLAGYVIGKSSWGRRGLIIATAVGVHPRFSGCLTLELSNVGEVPIEIRPGMSICQLFLHTVIGCEKDEVPGIEAGERSVEDPSLFSGSRLPKLGEIRMDQDPVAMALQQKMPIRQTLSGEVR